MYFMVFVPTNPPASHSFPLSFEFDNPKLIPLGIQCMVRVFVYVFLFLISFGSRYHLGLDIIWV
jgi:hypothetical protein